MAISIILLLIRNCYHTISSSLISFSFLPLSILTTGVSGFVPVPAAVSSRLMGSELGLSECSYSICNSASGFGCKIELLNPPK